MYLPFVDHLVFEIDHILLQNNERYVIQVFLPDKVVNMDRQQMADIYTVVQEDFVDDQETFILGCGRW
jgi:hypothetical protein